MKTFGMSVEYYKLCRHPVFCYYNRKERVENMPKNIAVITGASGGLGREFVRLFTKDDSIQEIWAVARKKDKLEKLQKEFGSKIRIFSYDLSDIEQIERFTKEYTKGSIHISYLVNNAGYAKFGAYNDISVSQSLNMIQLNVNSVVAMGLYSIPYMSAGSHIINIASQASFQPLPYLNIYAATKAFVRNYTRALHQELKERRISATAVCPGWMHTDFIQAGKIGAKKSVNCFWGIVMPHVVAKKAVKDAKKGKDISVYGWYVKTCHVLSKIIPQRLVMYVWKKQQHF